MNIKEIAAYRPTITRKRKAALGGAAAGAVVGGTIGFGVTAADRKYGILNGRTVKRSKRVEWYGQRIDALLEEANKCDDHDKATRLRAEAKTLSEQSLALQNLLAAKQQIKDAKKKAAVEEVKDQAEKVKASVQKVKVEAEKVEDLLDGCCPRDPEAAADDKAQLTEMHDKLRTRDEAWVKETSEAIIAAGQHHNNKVLLGLDLVDVDTIIDFYPEFATEWMGDTWKGWTPQYKRHAPPMIIVPGVTVAHGDSSLQFTENGLVYNTADHHMPVAYEQSNSPRTNAIRKTMLIQRLNEWYAAKAAGKFSAQAHTELDKQPAPAA